MVKVELQSNGMILTVSFMYSLDYVARIKKVPKARYIPDEKVWYVPVESLPQLEELFRGELVYVTPRHVILDEPPPPPPEWINEIPIYKPTDMKLPLYPYQQVGASYLAYNVVKKKWGILGDLMGLGKTAMAIGGVLILKEHYQLPVNRVLVVVPAPLKHQWVRDGIEKFTNCSYTLIEASKRPQNRHKLYDNDTLFTIVNYELVLKDKDAIAQVMKTNPFQLIICDEAHKLKNYRSKTNNAMVKLFRDKVLGFFFLSGTPLQNYPEDLYAIVRIADKDFFGPVTKFLQEYVKYDYYGGKPFKVGYKNLDKLAAKLEGYILRRTAPDIQSQLPELVHTRLMVKPDSAQKVLLEEIQEELRNVQAKLQKTYTDPKHHDRNRAINALENSIKGLIALQVMVCDTYHLLTLSKSAFVKRFLVNNIPSTTIPPKLELLLDILAEEVAAGTSVIVFTQFANMANYIVSLLREKHIPAAAYTGSLNSKERQELIESFNRGVIKVLVGTDAMSTGLNLQKSNLVINYDLPWNPAVLQQRMGRIQRLGSQHEVVRVIDLITEGTIEERIVDALEQKQNLFRILVDDHTIT